MPISSSHFDVSDYDEALELYYRNGWTDGLPIVPPTPEKVERFLQALHHRNAAVKGT